MLPFLKNVKRGKKPGNSLTFLLTSAVVLGLSLATTTVALGPMVPKEQQNTTTNRGILGVADHHLDIIQGFIQANSPDFINDANYVLDPNHAGDQNDGLPNYKRFMNTQSDFTTYFATGHAYGGLANITSYTENLTVNGQTSGLPVTSTLSFQDPTSGQYGLIRFFNTSINPGLYRNAMRATVVVTDNNGHSITRTRIIPLDGDKCADIAYTQNSVNFDTAGVPTYPDTPNNVFRITQINGAAMLVGDMKDDGTYSTPGTNYGSDSRLPARTFNTSNSSAIPGRRSQYICWLPTEIYNGLNCDSALYWPYGTELVTAYQDIVNGFQRRVVVVLMHNTYFGNNTDGDTLRFYYYDGRSASNGGPSSYDNDYWHQTDLNDGSTPYFTANSRPEDYSFTVFRAKSANTSTPTNFYKGLMINKFYNTSTSQYELRYSIARWGDRELEHSQGLFMRGTSGTNATRRTINPPTPVWYSLSSIGALSANDYFRYFPDQRLLVVTQNNTSTRRIVIYKFASVDQTDESTMLTPSLASTVPPYLDLAYSPDMRFGKPELSSDGLFVLVPVQTHANLSSGNQSQIRIMAISTTNNQIVPSTNLHTTSGQNATVIMSYTAGDGIAETGTTAGNQPPLKGGHVRSLNDILLWYSPQKHKFYWIVRNANTVGGSATSNVPNPNQVIYEWDPKSWGAGGASTGGQSWFTISSPDKLKTNTVYAGESPALASPYNYTGEYRSVRIIRPYSTVSGINLWQNDMPPKVMENPKFPEAYIRDSANLIVLNYDLGYTTLASSSYSSELGNGYTMAIDPNTGRLYYSTKTASGLHSYDPESKTVATVPLSTSNTNFSDGTPGDGDLVFAAGTQTLYYIDTPSNGRPQVRDYRQTCSGYGDRGGGTVYATSSSVFNSAESSTPTTSLTNNAMGGGNRAAASSSTVPYSLPFTDPYWTSQ